MLRQMLLATTVVLAFTDAAYAANPDAAGCKDCFVSRLAGYYISDCTQSNFDSFTFAYQEPGETKVEGMIVSNSYSQPDVPRRIHQHWCIIII